MKLAFGAFVTLLLAAYSSALDCGGPVDIVVAVPGSNDTVPSFEFQHIENFLVGVLSYFDVSAGDANVGLVLYGREPVVFAYLGNTTTSQALNARITLLSQREAVHNQISGGQNVPKAIQKVHEMLLGGRDGVPKIGVIMTYGSSDLTSSDSQEVAERIDYVSSSALNDGINLFATNTGGGFRGFPNITQDFCRLFSLGQFTQLGSLLPYLASSMCYVVDDDVTPSSLNCFPEVKQPSPQENFTCDLPEGHLADPTNCAYYYDCESQFRMPCPDGLLFDPSIKRCNHKEFVTCYSGLSCPSAEGLFPHPRDCSMFLSCSENIPHVHKCPAGLFFNPASLHCDYQENVECAA